MARHAPRRPPALLKDQGKPTTPEKVAKVEDRKIPGPAGDIATRVYTPDGAGPFPVVVYFHGGGFVIADLDTYDASARALANQAKAVVVSVEYRHAPEAPFPAAADVPLRAPRTRGPGARASARASLRVVPR